MTEGSHHFIEGSLFLAYTQKGRAILQKGHTFLAYTQKGRIA
jgi:hypothetical protein